MTPQVIAVSGYGGTGSSAITDLLAEFSNGKSMGGDEFWFLQDWGGISELHFNLIEGNHRSKVSHALKTYLRYCKKNRKFYEKHFGRNFIKITECYIDSLIDARFKKAISENEFESWFLRILLLKIFPKISSILAIISGRYHSEWCGGFVNIEKFYTIPDELRFFRETKKYMYKLISEIDGISESKFVAFDQIVPSIGATRYLNYIEGLKIIIVDRDPRDLYILNKTHWRGAPYICNTDDVGVYINWYKTMRMHKKFENPSQKIMYINFENLVLNYDDALDEIYNFLSIDPIFHTKKRSIFNPDISIKNVGLWKKNNEYANDIKIIEKNLSEFLYHE